MLVIKRYPNRKLYDTEAKQYITLDQVADLIRSGVDVKVVDNATGEDLSALTLSQIIFEQEKKQSGFLPLSLLSGLIQSGGDRFSSLQRTLASTLGFTTQVDEEIERRIRILVGRGDLDEEQGNRLLKKLLSISGQPEVPDRVIEKLLAAYRIPSRSDFQQLLDQIDQLSGQIDELKAGSENQT